MKFVVWKMVLWHTVKSGKPKKRNIELAGISYIEEHW